MYTATSVVLLVAAFPLPQIGVSTHCVKPPCLPGLPSFDYQSSNTPSRLETAVSLLFLEMRSDVPGRKDQKRVRYFQLEQPQIKIDHCSISQVCLILHEDGWWTLSLRADQNPFMEGTPQNAVTATVVSPQATNFKQTTQLKRNLFQVRIRCLGAAKADERAVKPLVGKPVLFELVPAPFWVERGQPYDLWVRQPLGDVRQFFETIDRIEVDFCYR